MAAIPFLSLSLSPLLYMHLISFVSSLSCKYFVVFLSIYHNNKNLPTQKITSENMYIYS